MGKPDFFALKRPELPRKTETLRDSRQGLEWEFCLQAPNRPEQLRAEQLGTEMTVRLIGIPEEDIAPSETFPPLAEGTQVELSELLLRKAALLYVMQRPIGKSDRLEFDEIVAMSATSPEMWDQAIKLRDELIRQAEDLQKKTASETTTGKAAD